ncbi:MAG: hypothetical protein KY469_11440 [Actinobacteria bacterium]|nr:hypothetical protein [Actinomycetota bacterium]
MDLERLPWKLRYRTLRGVASTLRRWSVEVTHRHTTVRFGPGCYVGPGFHLTIPYLGGLIVGRDVEFRRGFTCEIADAGRVTIGDGAVFTYDTVIQCSTTVTIGERCAIGRALIADGTHRFRDATTPMDEQGFDFRPITIGADTRIMTGAVVTNSVGRSCVVGANAVVLDPIPDFSLAVGAPARVVEHYGPDVPEA